jgi:hypothetical protein
MIAIYVPTIEATRAARVLQRGEMVLQNAAKLLICREVVSGRFTANCLFDQQFGWMANPPAGTAPAPLFRHAFRKGALHERGDGVCNRNGDESQENVASNVTCSAGRMWIAKSAYTSRTGGLLGSTSLSSIGAMPMMPMTAGSLPPFFTPS